MRLPFWKSKPMVGEAALEAREVAQEASHRETFLRLVEQYESPLRRLAGAYFDHKADQADLFQEIAVAIWQALPRFRGESSQRTWLYRIAHNVATTSAAKHRRKERTEVSIPESFDRASPSSDAERELLLEEKRRLLSESVRDLPVMDRQIILLHLEGLSYSEIEEVSGLSESAVATRLTRIRDKLKEKIETRRPATHER